MNDRMPTRKYAYFRDDQMMILATHDAEQLSPIDLQDLQKAMRDKLGGLIITKPPQPYSFPAVQTDNLDQRLEELQALEISRTEKEKTRRLEELQRLRNLLEKEAGTDPDDVKNLRPLLKRTDKQKLLAGVKKRENTLNKSGAAADEPRLFRTPFSLLQCELEERFENPRAALKRITEFRDSLKGEQFGQLGVVDVSPNWIMSVASQGGATGGPGALPMPFLEGDSPTYQFDQLKQALTDANLYDEGANVDVAILDTCPSDHELALATKNLEDHPLLKTLLAPSGWLLIPYHASLPTLLRMASTSINQHDYPMTNHGLFAAGIVHSIVPKARIHLIEVLNEFGVGDLASLAEGLSLAYKQIYKPGSGRRLVVNCSWMLDLPGSDLHFSAPQEAPEHDFEVAIRQFIEEDEKGHTLMIRTICDNLALTGSQVVAAAGNDKKYARAGRDKRLQRWTEGAMPEKTEDWIEHLIGSVRGWIPDARYPAAFASVIGVGALPKGDRRNVRVQQYESTDYSNLGDKPAGEAIMTLGGEEGRDSDNNNKGILGLYVGDMFPEVEEEEMTGAEHRRKIRMVNYPNEGCWAWWAGTSFAAPIVTGAIAAVLGSKTARTQDAVAELKKCVIEEAGTAALEDIMYVKQGP